jgi:hypothetical protein
VVHRRHDRRCRHLWDVDPAGRSGNAFGQNRFGGAVAAAVRRRLALLVWGGWWLGIAALLLIGLGT